jgi:type I restriction enzyme S subunit
MRPTDALEHPADWSVTTVGKDIEIRRGLSWSKDQEKDHNGDGTVPVLRISNVQDRLELDDILYLAGVPARAREKKKASQGWSIIVGSNGNRQRIGNAVYQNVDTDYLFASFLISSFSEKLYNRPAGARRLHGSGIVARLPNPE